MRERAEPTPQIEAMTTVGEFPTRIDMNLYQGDDFFLNVVVNSPSPVDLTGYIPKAEIRTTPGAVAVLATFDATISAVDTVSLHLTSLEATLVPATAAWDLQVIDPTGVVTTLVFGSVTSMREVTTT